MVDIGILDRDAGMIDITYTIERGVRFPLERIPIVGLRKHVLDTRAPLLINERVLERLPEFDQPGDLLLGEPAKSLLFVPLIMVGEAFGVISLQNLDREHAFTDGDVRLLTTLAGSLSVALENARLFEEARQRNAELALINDVQRGLAQNLEMQAMYDLVGDRIRDIFDAQVVDIGILDEDAGLIRFPYTIERGVRFPDEPIEVVGPRRVVLETREPLVFNEGAMELVAELGSAPVLQGEPARSVVYVPLVVGPRATGVVSLQNLDREHAFSDADVRLLTTLAGSLSAALENARLFEETRQRNAELALINEVQRGLVENLDPQAMYDLVGERIQEIFDAQTVDIGMLDETTDQIWFPYSLERGKRLLDHPIEVMGFRKIALDSHEPVVVNDDMERRCIEAGNPFAIAGEPSLSSVFVPLVVGSRGTGVVSLHNLDREHAFSEGDVRLLTTIARGLSVALENARLFEETRQRNAELALINEVQRGLAENLEMQAMYNLLGDRIRDIFDAQVVDIGILNEEGSLIRFPYTIERGIRFPDEPVDVIGFRRHTLETGEPLLIQRWADGLQLVPDEPESIAGEPPRSAVFVPLMVGGVRPGSSRCRTSIVRTPSPRST